MNFGKLQKWARQVYEDFTLKRCDNGMIEKMVYGEYILVNRIYDSVVDEAIPKIRQRIYEAKNHLERVKLFDEFYSEEKFLKFLASMDEALDKDESITDKFREKSLGFYAQGNYEMAARCSNMALLFAPGDDSSLMSGLHADLAFVMRALKETDHVINNVEIAIALDEDMCKKLMKKLMSIKKKSLMSRAMKQLEKSDSELEFQSETKKRQKFCDDVLFSVYGDPHLKIQSCGNYLNIATDPVKGRILVVTENVRAGTTIIVEDAYVSVLTESLKWEMKHCSRCYKKTWGLVPCPNCVYTTYCSEDCRLTDYENWHKFECPCLNYFHAINIPPSFQMGFRAVCKAGPKYMFQLYQKINAGWKQDPEQIPGINPDTGKYDSDYFQTYHLASHLCGQHLEFHTWHSFAIAKLLNIKTNFFELIDQTHKSSFMDFIASCFLQHSIAIPYNVISIWEEEKPERPKTTNFFAIKSADSVPEMSRIERLYKYGCIGMTGVFPLCSLLSHSCDPSAIGVPLKNGKLAIVTCRALKAGDEVTLSYGYEFTAHELNERRSGLMERYNFMCECVACATKWLTGDQIGREIELVCPKCTHKYSYEERSKLRNCVLAKGGHDLGTCGNCKETFYTPILTKNITKYHGMIGEARQLLIRDKPVESIPLLVESIEFFQSKVVSPSLPMIQAQSLLTWAYESIATNSRI